MLPASSRFTESTPRRITMAKEKATIGGAANGTNPGFEAKLRFITALNKPLRLPHENRGIGLTAAADSNNSPIRRSGE